MNNETVSKHAAYLSETRQEWDQRAASFDDQPDHGLRDAGIRQSWTDLLNAWLPPAPVDMLDIGCGTGSLSVVLAELGHRVTAIDWSPAMITIARQKAQRQNARIDFQRMDAAFPDFPDQRFEVIICRHLLWALPEPAAVLRRWHKLLTRQGRLILIEGYWNGGGGLHAAEVLKMLTPDFPQISLQLLSDNGKLWGKRVQDERYAILACGDL